jgi:hypothetical protein
MLAELGQSALRVSESTISKMCTPSRRVCRFGFYSQQYNGVFEVVANIS